MAEKQSAKAEVTKAIDDIVATKVASTISIEEVSQDLTGKKPETYAGTSKAQADYLPGVAGSIIRDPTYVPEFAFVDDKKVRVTHPSEYVYRWATDSKIMHWKLVGFRFMSYDDTFRGTDLYERTIEGHVRNGDVRLMYAPKRLWERYVESIEDRRQAMEGATTEQLHNDGYRRGVRTFEERDGNRLSN